VWAGDSYLERPCDGRSIVYGLHYLHLGQTKKPPGFPLNITFLHIKHGFSIIFFTCGEPAFSVDALVDRPSKLNRSGFTY